MLRSFFQKEARVPLLFHFRSFFVPLQCFTSYIERSKGIFQSENVEFSPFQENVFHKRGGLSLANFMV